MFSNTRPVVILGAGKYNDGVRLRNTLKNVHLIYFLFSDVISCMRKLIYNNFPVESLLAFVSFDNRFCLKWEDDEVLSVFVWQL